MADIDIDPFGEHDRTESRTDETGENIPLPLVIPGEGGVPTWVPTKQETSFGGEKMKEGLVKELNLKLFKHLSRTQEEFHFNDFKLRDEKLYYKGVSKSLTKRRVELRTVKELADILGKKRLNKLSFSIPKSKGTICKIAMLNKAQRELPSESDIAKTDDIELREIMENASRSIESLNQQVQEEPTEDLPMQELLGLDKQLRSIRDSLKVEVAMKIELEECIKKEHGKLKEFQEYPGEYDDSIQEKITKRIDTLNDELKVRQESIDLLKCGLRTRLRALKSWIETLY